MANIKRHQAAAHVATALRDTADEDYRAARLSYRYEATQPFLWSAQQAVEKYLKAILLYSCQPTVGLGHDLQKAIERLATIRDISFDFPEDIRRFIEYLNVEGPNRYRDYPTMLHGDALLGLDRTVWYLRRYCYDMRGNIGKPTALRLSDEIERLRREDPVESRHRFRIPNGHLERVLSRKSPARQQLVWKNFYYGSRRRRRIARFPHRWASSRPMHYMRPEIYVAVKDLVKFDPAVAAYFAAQGTEP